jgi:hypothetical protein
MLKLFYQHMPFLETWYSHFHVVNLMYLLHFDVVQKVYGTFSGSPDYAVSYIKSPNYLNYVVSLHRTMD